SGNIATSGNVTLTGLSAGTDLNTVLMIDGSNMVRTLSTASWDKDATDDLTISTNFSGDVTGLYNNLQLGTGVVGSTELASSGVNAGSYGTVGGTAAYFPVLTIDEDGRITSANTAVFTLDFENPLTFGNGLTRSGNTINLGGSLNADTRIYIGNTDVLFFDFATGNLGIGNTDPQYKLDVEGTLRASGIRLNEETITDFTGTGLTLTGGVLTID